MEHPNLSDHPHKLILVVDDDEDIGIFVVEALNGESSYRALLATDAAEALALVETLRPDLCISDYHLRGITGLELAERLHQMEAFQQLPIILMSAQAPEHVKEREDLTFLEKPFSLDELLTTVEQLLDSEAS